MARPLHTQHGREEAIGTKGQFDMLQSAAAVAHPYGSGRPDFAGLEPTMKLFSGGKGGAAASGFIRARRSVNWLISAVLATMIVVTASGLWLRYTDASHEAARNAGNMTEVLAEYLNIRLAAVDSVLARMVATSRRLGGPSLSPREWGLAIRSSTSGVPGLSAVSITNSEGAVLYSTILALKGVDWSEQPIFQKLKAGHPNLLAAAPPIEITGGNQVLVPIGRQLTNARGEFIGTVIATLVSNHLKDFDDSFDFGGAGVAWAMVPSGDVVFRQASGDVSNETIDTRRPEFMAGELSEAGGIVEGPITAGGADYVTAYRRGTNADLVLAVSLARSDFLPNWRTEIAIALAALALAAALLLFARHRIFRAIGDAEADAADGEAEIMATR